MYQPTHGPDLFGEGVRGPRYVQVRLQELLPGWAPAVGRRRQPMPTEHLPDVAGAGSVPQFLEFAANALVAPGTVFLRYTGARSVISASVSSDLRGRPGIFAWLSKVHFFCFWRRCQARSVSGLAMEMTPNRCRILRPYLTDTRRSASVSGTREPSLPRRNLFPCLRKSFSKAKSRLKSRWIFARSGLAEFRVRWSTRPSILMRLQSRNFKPRGSSGTASMNFRTLQGSPLVLPVMRAVDELALILCSVSVLVRDSGANGHHAM